MNQRPAIIEASNLCKSFGRGRTRVDVLRGLDISIPQGRFAAIMGPSGCGKSTLLHVLGLMTTAGSGSLRIDGEAINGSAAQQTQLRRRKIGFVFQRFNLIPVLTGRDNISVSLKVRGVRDDDGRVESLLETMQVAQAARRKPAAMSIGEQQRIAVVRALAHRPAILLADEPTGNLDSDNADALLKLFARVHTETGQTIVMITHSPEAAARAEVTYRMKDGKILQPS
ncbi:MAG: ABC transporter ATP-binding protein [Phycisphaerae bacterium]